MNPLNWVHYIVGSALDPLTLILVIAVLLKFRQWWIIPVAIVARFIFVAILLALVDPMPSAFNPTIQIVVSCVQVLVVYFLINSISALTKKLTHRKDTM